MPSNDILPYHDRRVQMVEYQLKKRGIRDKGVLEAMLEIPRHSFVPPMLDAFAYEDRPLEIGYGQTISQPYMVAFMTEMLQLTKAGKVLEVGTGSGYQAAVLSKICSQVYTIEIIKELANFAQAVFQKLGYDNIDLKVGDGAIGWKEVGPFDEIMVTAASKDMLYQLIEQLKVGGYIVIPLEKAPYQQVLIRVQKLQEPCEYQVEELFPAMFVPLTS